MTLPGSFLRVDQIATLQGYGFVTSGFATNGLAVRQGLADLIDAVEIFTAQHGEPSNVILVGVSEGGLIAALGVEEHGNQFDGAVALCGTYGDYAAQTDYLGDFRVLFDYFFPDLLPPTAVDIPASLLNSWDDTFYPDTVEPVISAVENRTTVAELFDVAEVAHDTDDTESWAAIIGRLLWYNVHATGDAVMKLGGQPFENQAKIYSGSQNDEELNQDVARFTADTAARATIAADYETSGNLQRPLVTLHTNHDPLVPVWHVEQYQEKVAGKGKQLYHQHIEVDAYGHCAFSLADAQAAFNTITEMMDDPPQQTYMPLAAR